MARIYTKNKGDALDKFESLVTVGNAETLGGKSAEYYDNNSDVCVNLLNPTLQTTTSNGVTCTNNGDGTYTLSGTASVETRFTIISSTSFPNGDYKYIGTPKTGTYDFYTYNYHTTAGEYGDGKLWSITDGRLCLQILIKANVTLNNVVFKPMITTNLNATYDDFVPYTGEGKKLNECVSDLVLHPQVSNPNLLINGDFRVNQRNGYYAPTGITYYSDTALSTSVSTLTANTKVTYVNSTYCSVVVDSTTYYVKTSDCVKGYVGTGYTMDMWKRTWGDGTLTINDDGTVTTTNNTNGSWVACSYTQVIECGTYDFKNKTLTFSAIVNDKLITHTFTVGETKYTKEYCGSDGTYWNISINVDGTNSSIHFGSYGNIPYSKTWKYVKLEFGSVATPLSPRPYGEELALCQRYYVTQTSIFGHPNYDGTTVVFELPLCLRKASGSIVGTYGTDYGVVKNGSVLSNATLTIQPSDRSAIYLTGVSGSYTDRYLLFINTGGISMEL